MKTKFNILAVLCIAIVLWSCEKQLEKPVKFDVAVSQGDKALAGTTFAVDSGSKVKFDFSGDPDFITFFNGTNGHEYAKRNLFEIPVNEITSKLKFSVEPQYGIIDGTLKVFLSTEFEGLLGSDKQKDSLTILNTKWVEVTDQCNLPTKSKQKVNVEIPLDDYLGSKVALGFLYKTEINTSSQPTWIIRSLNIENTQKETNQTSNILAKNMGFRTLDMYSSNPYANEGGSGIWDLRNMAKKPSVIRIQSSPSDAPINYDWLTSNPILINSRDGDTGFLIKKMSIDVDSYEYTFKNKGTYVFTFVGRNANYKYDQEVVREFTFEVK